MHLPRLSAASLMLIIACAPLQSVAQEPAQDHFIVDGEPVYLTTSDQYRALSINADTRGAFDAAVKSGGVATIVAAPMLDRYGIVLLKQDGAVTRGAFDAGMRELTVSAPVEAELPVYTAGNVDQVLPNEFIVQFAEGVADDDIKIFLDEHDAELLYRSTKIPNRVTVTMPGKTVRDALKAVNGFHESDLVQFAEPNFIRIMPQRPKVIPGTPATSPSTSTAQPPPTPGPAAVGNDPLFTQQWGLDNAGSPGVAGADISAREAWDVTTGSQQVIIAILDEGVDITHPDLAAKIVTPYDATDGDDNQQPNDWDGHGTACAGIAAAIGNNQEGIAGVSWSARILPVRIASSPGPGQGWITSNSMIEDGIRTAVDRGAHVLSNSWGGGLPSNAITSAVDYALSNGRTVVFAAGNDSGPVSYPATLSSTREIITVSASNEWDEFKTTASQDGESWWGSNFGPQINVAAPGVHIMTTDISGSVGYVAGNYVSTFNGTSSATPFVAGAAALLLAEHPGATPAQVRDWLEGGADDLGANGFDNQFGHGRLNADAAITLSNAQVPINLALTIDNAGDYLDESATTSSRATVTRGGSPEAGITVNFVSADTSLVSVLPASAVTDANGVATTQLTGETSSRATTQVTASANGETSSQPVKVPDLPAWAIVAMVVFMLAIGRIRRQ